MSNEKDLKTRVVTGRVTLNFAHLFKVNECNKNNTGQKYDATIIVDKNDEETLSKMYSAINNAAELGGFADVSDFKSPLNDGDVLHPGENLYKNCMYLYASSFLRPRVVDHNVQDIKFRVSEFPAGTYAKTSLEFVPYKHDGKFGVSAKLVNVQILPQNKLEELRSAPEDDFVVEEI